MLRLQWTAEEVTRLQDLRRHHPNPRVRRKAEAVYLKSLNLPHHEIARIVGVTEKTARSYLQAYAAGGIDALSAGLIRVRCVTTSTRFGPPLRTNRRPPLMKPWPALRP